MYQAWYNFDRGSETAEQDIMNKPFALFLLKRVLLQLLAVVTAPIWIPVAAVFMIVAYLIVIPFCEWYTACQNDYMNEQRWKAAKEAEKDFDLNPPH